MNGNKWALFSKLNWAGFILVVLGGLQELNWVDVLGSDVGGKIVAGIGLLIMVFRTFFTDKQVTIKKE